MTTVTIRTEAPHDHETISLVTREAFRAAPHADGNEEYVIIGLRRAGALVLSLVAETRGEIVGHVAMSPVSIDDGTRGWLGLGPLSVLPAHQRLGLGGRLVVEGLARIRAAGAHGCVVLGAPQYYERFGYRPHAALRFPAAPAPYFLAIRFEGTMPEGVVTYHEAFFSNEGRSPEC